MSLEGKQELVVGQSQIVRDHSRHATIVARYIDQQTHKKKEFVIPAASKFVATIQFE